MQPTAVPLDALKQANPKNLCSVTSTTLPLAGLLGSRVGAISTRLAHKVRLK